MSASKRIAFAISVAWLSRLITILINFGLIPIMYRNMGKEELGLLFLLGNSQAFLGLLGMGIAPTLMRHIALAKGKSGSDPNVELTAESQRHIGDLVATGRTMLQTLAVLTFFIAWFSGYGLIGKLDLKEISFQTVFLSWTLMCVGYSINVWVSYLDSLIAGVGFVGWDSILNMVLALLTTIASIAAVLMDGGILVLSAISVGSALLQRFLFLVFMRWRKPELLKIQGKWNSDYAKAMVKPSLFAWFTSLGAFFVLSTDSYFIALLRNVSELPAYRGAYQLVSNIYMVVNPLAFSASTFISQMWQAGDLKGIQRIVIRNARLTMCFMASGVAFVLIAGKEFLDLWLGEGNFIGYGILVIFSVMLTLEAQHNVLATSSRATEDEKYAPWAIASGILNLIFTWWLIKPFGLLGVAMGTMLAQMLTNNWYAVYRPLVRLKLSFKLYFDQVILLWAGVLCLSLSSAGLAKFVVDSATRLPLLGMLAAAIACGLVLVYSIWFRVFEPHEKQKITAKLLQFLGKLRQT
jgi:O-antigen/teichoic acid export membrane protein